MIYVYLENDSAGGLNFTKKKLLQHCSYGRKNKKYQQISTNVW